MATLTADDRLEAYPTRREAAYRPTPINAREQPGARRRFPSPLFHENRRVSLGNAGESRLRSSLADASG